MKLMKQIFSFLVVKGLKILNFSTKSKIEKKNYLATFSFIVSKYNSIFHLKIFSAIYKK